MFGGNAAHIALLRKNDREVLLIRRRDIPVWVLPGGHLERGESYKQAAIREFKEETGLTITPTKLVVEYKSPDKSVTKRIYLAKYVDGKLTSSPETRGISWFKVSELPYPMTLYEKTRISDVFKATKSPIRKIFVLNKFKELFHHLNHPLWLLILVLTQFKSILKNNDH